MPESAYMIQITLDFLTITYIYSSSQAEQLTIPIVTNQGTRGAAIELITLAACHTCTL